MAISDPQLGWNTDEKEQAWKERTTRENESWHRVRTEKSSSTRNALLLIMCFFLLVQTSLSIAWEVRYQVLKHRANEMIEQLQTAPLDTP